MQDLITLEDDYPVFNPEARLIKEFLAIIVRDRGSKGDAQGRKKSLATKELAFVHFFTSLTSQQNINIEDEEERTKAIKRELDLPDEWKIDKIVRDAIDKYADYQETPTSGILQTVRRTLNKSKKVFLFLEGKLDILLESLITNSDLTDEQIRATEDRVIASVNKIMELSAKLTTQIETVDNLEKKYVKELEEKKGRNKSAVNQYEL